MSITVLAVLSLSAVTGERVRADDPTPEIALTWPTPGPSVFVEQRSTDLAPHRHVVATILFDYAHRQVVAHEPDLNLSYEPVRGRLMAHTLLAVGLWDTFQFEFGLPLLLVQTGVGLSPFEEPLPPREQTVVVRLGNVRGGGVLRLRKRDAFPGLVVTFTAAVPTADRFVFLGDNQWTLAPGVASDHRVGPLLLGIDASARLRFIERQLGDATLGHQALVRTALGWLLGDERTSLSFGATAVADLQKPRGGAERQHAGTLDIALRHLLVEPAGCALRASFSVGAGGLGAPAFVATVGVEQAYGVSFGSM